MTRDLIERLERIGKDTGTPELEVIERTCREAAAALRQMAEQKPVAWRW